MPHIKDIQFIPILNKLKNIEVVNDINFNQFLDNYDPKIVIIEYPSTPLYQGYWFGCGNILYG